MAARKDAADTSPGWLGKGRLEALSDGIFAFAMTLLVMNIEVPDEVPAMVAPEPVQQLLSKLYPDFTHYFLAFIMLAAFWVIHHSFMSHIRTVDRKTLWLNILGLMFIALMPFSTQLADTYISYPVSAMIFELNVFLVGMVFLLQWRHASDGRRLIAPELADGDIEHLARVILVLPALSLAAMSVAFMGFTWSIILYALLPLVYTLWPRKS
jgi:uncharacterized membrane protein